MFICIWWDYTASFFFFLFTYPICYFHVNQPENAKSGNIWKSAAVKFQIHFWGWAVPRTVVNLKMDSSTTVLHFIIPALICFFLELILLLQHPEVSWAGGACLASSPLCPLLDLFSSLSGAFPNWIKPIISFLKYMSPLVSVIRH